MTEIVLQGDEPFALPATQRASAIARQTGAVEMTLYVLKDARELVPVQTAMTHQVASELAEQLTRAALKIELGE
jgi:hypothetical protein